MKTDGNCEIRLGFVAAMLTLFTASGLLILGQLGRMSPSLDVFSHLSSHYVAMGISALAALWFGRHHFVVLGLGAVFTILGHSALSLAPDLPSSSVGKAVSQNLLTLKAFANAPVPAPGKNRALKIVSLNSWHSNRSPEKIVSYLRKVKADVVILIEFGPSKLKLLPKLAQDYPYSVQCAGRWYCSMVLLSRLPLKAARVTSPTNLRPAFVWARVRMPGREGREITVIGTHIYRPSTRPRLHVSHLNELAKFVNGLKGPYILAGDFNATPWSQSYRSFMRKTKLTAPGPMLPSWPAWPLPLPQVAIDHLFASKSLSIVGRGVGPNVGSDHLPIWALVRAMPPRRRPVR